MKLVRTLLATAALTLLFSVSQPTFAQEQNQADRSAMPPATITGCLMKADTGDQWMLVDTTSGNKIVVTGSDFDKHANHTVRITGTSSQDGKSFTVAKIEHVADSCQAK